MGGKAVLEVKECGGGRRGQEPQQYFGLLGSL